MPGIALRTSRHSSPSSRITTTTTTTTPTSSTYLFNQLLTPVLDDNTNLFKKLIVSKRAPLVCPNPESGAPILFFAIEFGRNEIVRFLLERGHDHEEVSKDFHNTTSFMVAAKHKNEEAFKHYYTLHPQALFWKNDDGMCALHFAAKSGCLNIVKFILDRGANVCERDANGDTPLHHAASWGHYEIVMHLISHGAPTNFPNNAGWTPVDYAFEKTMAEQIIECQAAQFEGRLASSLKRPGCGSVKSGCGSSYSVGSVKSVFGLSLESEKLDMRMYF